MKLEFDDQELKQKLRKLTELSDIKGYDVGFFEGRYPIKTKRSKSSKSVRPPPQVAQVAIDNEFGTSRTPARPFFTLANKKVEKELVEILISQLNLDNSYKLTSNLVKLLAIKHKSAVQNSIRDLREPPNAPSTLKAKSRSNGDNRDNPLVDTGFMLNSVTYKILKSGDMNE